MVYGKILKLLYHSTDVVSFEWEYSLSSLKTNMCSEQFISPSLAVYK